MFDKNHYSIAIDDLLQIKDDCHIFLVDKHNLLIACNVTQFNMLKETSGVTSYEEVIGQPLEKLLSTAVASMATEENKQVMNTGKAQVFSNFVTLKNFKSLLLVTVKTPLYDTKKHIIGVLGIAHIISSHTIQHDLSEKLTKRESICLTHLLKGKTANEIAQEMKLSRRTIEVYTSTIKEKLGCESKSTLINKVFEVGLSSLLTASEAISESFKPGDFIPILNSDTIKK